MSLLDEIVTVGPYIVAILVAVGGLLWAPYVWKRRNLQAQKEAIHQLHVWPHRFCVAIQGQMKSKPGNLDLVFLRDTARQTLLHLAEDYAKAAHYLPLYLNDAAQTAMASLSKISWSEKLVDNKDLWDVIRDFFDSTRIMLAGAMVHEER